jgi:hypothetical protein
VALTTLPYLGPNLKKKSRDILLLPFRELMSGYRVDFTGWNLQDELYRVEFTGWTLQGGIYRVEFTGWNL